VTALRESPVFRGTETADGAAPFDPPENAVPARIVRAAAQVKSTPGILWDVPGLTAHIGFLGRLLARHGLSMHCALKACASAPIVRLLRETVRAADVATAEELRLARSLGFSRISATGPAFAREQIPDLLAGGVLFDAQSPVQLDQLLEQPFPAAAGGAVDWGVRVRVPLPDVLRSSTSRGQESRFGLVLDERLADRLRSAPQPVRRVRVHTGEVTPDLLAFRARYAVLVARLLGTVDQINLGGGLLRLSRRPDLLDATLRTIGAELRAYDGPELSVWMEPGAALTLDHAYLVTQVLDADCASPHGQGVVVDASAWNLAPWAYPSFHPVADASQVFTGDVFGPSLYEKDRFRRTARTPSATRLAVGDRLLATSFGAYTLVHARQFGQLPVPDQYLVDDHGMERVDERP
jgi:diaminopimelate decarboxylase